MTTTGQNISTDVSHSKPDLKPVKNPSHNAASRPDWLLYTVPGTAFVIGIVLFTYICKTQRSRNAATGKRTHTNGNRATLNNYGSSTQSYVESTENNNKVDETRSYENLEAAIYNNHDKITYHVSADEDYLKPDVDGEEEVMGPNKHQNTLQLPSNLTDTDGESYENMEGCLYAQPRKRTQRIQTEDGDYINPDDDGNQDRIQDHTDTESYEIMAGSDCIYNNSDFTAEDDSYELMNGIPVPIQKWTVGGRESE